MKILNKQPPFWPVLHHFFPSASLEKQVFAFYPNIYSSVNLSEDIIEHEKTHLARQKSFIGACWWWFRYISSPKFRVKEEIEADRARLRFVSGKYKKWFVDDLRVMIARNLASDVYGHCLSYDEALKLLS